MKPVDSWRKHKKALNAAKYYEELPATDKINSNQESKVPVETKPDLKIVKTVKSNKKTSTISLPVTKQVNNPDSSITVLNSSLPGIIKKPIASVAPYQIVLPKQTNVIVPQERTIEKLNIPKSKLIQTVQHKTEKEATTMKSSISKKSIGEDDGVLAEYKCMKKKNKTERKASLPPTSSSVTQVSLPVAVKPKVQTVERFNSSEIITTKIQTDEKFNQPEVIKSKSLVERFPSLEAVKPKVQIIERCNSPEKIKPKIQTVERYNSPELIKQNSNNVVPEKAIREKEKKEIPSLKNKHQTDQRSDIGKRITVLKRNSDEMRVELSSTVNNNKHGNIFYLKNKCKLIIFYFNMDVFAMGNQ